MRLFIGQIRTLRIRNIEKFELQNDYDLLCNNLLHKTNMRSNIQF